MAPKAILKGRPASPMKRASSLPGLKAKAMSKKPVSPKKEARGRSSDKKTAGGSRGGARPQSPLKPPRPRSKPPTKEDGDDPFGDSALAAAIAESAAAAGVSPRRSALRKDDVSKVEDEPVIVSQPEKVATKTADFAAEVLKKVQAKVGCDGESGSKVVTIRRHRRLELTYLRARFATPPKMI